MRSHNALSTIIICILCIAIFSMAMPLASAAKPADPPPLRLASTNPTDYGYFGSAVATGGGYVVVGGQYEASGGYAYAGNVYVFNAADGALVATLTSPSPARMGCFGASVAIGGGYIVVGAPNEGAGGYSYAGKVYVFNATDMALVATLASPSQQQSGAFGASVAIGGGYIVVGAPNEDVDGIFGAGSAYVFNAEDGALVAALVSQLPEEWGNFGCSVATDGVSVAVGAYCETSGVYACAGNAYVFNAADGTLVATLKSPSPAEDGAFGISVAVSGKRVAVGAPNENAGGIIGAGNAYVFTTSGKLSKTLSSPNAAEGGFFGYSVAMDGKGVAVGACREMSGSIMSGNAYIFTTSGKLSRTLASASPVGGGYFGYAVAMGVANVAVGACYELSGSIAAGSAYVFG